MQETIIPLDNPVTTPPQPAKVFNIGWLEDFTISAPPNQKAVVRAVLRGKTSAGEYAPDGTQETIVIFDALAVCAQVPEMAAAVDAIVAGLAAYKTWAKAQLDAPPETNPAS